MRRLAFRALPLSILAALVCAPAAAWAGTATDGFTVSATVIASCSVDAADLAFGNYNPVSSTPLDSATTMSVVCTNGTAYEVAIDAGLGAGATVASRKMSRSSDLLTYAVYRDAGRSNLLGPDQRVERCDRHGHGRRPDAQRLRPRANQPDRARRRL